MLLGMLGFSVTQHGRSQKLSDAPDIIAITPLGNVAVVECTVGLPDQDDQVAKALQRAETLRRSLLGSGWPGIQVLPVVVTPLSDAEIKGQKERAEGQGVLIGSLESLQNALTRVMIPTNADQLFNEAIAQLGTSSVSTNQSVSR